MTPQGIDKFLDYAFGIVALVALFAWLLTL